MSLEVPKDMLRMGVAWRDKITNFRIYHCSGGGWYLRECYEWVRPGVQGFSESNKEGQENILP